MMALDTGDYPQAALIFVLALGGLAAYAVTSVVLLSGAGGPDPSPHRSDGRPLTLSDRPHGPIR